MHIETHIHKKPRYYLPAFARKHNQSQLQCLIEPHAPILGVTVALGVDTFEGNGFRRKIEQGQGP